MALHVLILALASDDPFRAPRNADRTKADETIVVLMVVPSPPDTPSPSLNARTSRRPRLVVSPTQAHRVSPPTIASDGTLARLEKLWTTSTIAERLARKAIDSLPPLPPTPTGRPLIFDRTISFTPDAADAPPI